MSFTSGVLGLSTQVTVPVNVGPSLARERGAVGIAVEQFPNDEGAILDAAVRLIALAVRQQERASRPPNPAKTVAALEAEVARSKALATRSRRLSQRIGLLL
jgi:hypothetical protein